MSTSPWNRPTRSARLALAGVALAALAFACAPEKPNVEPPNTEPPRITQFSVSPEMVSVGASATLTWKTENATTIELRDAQKGVLSGVDPGQTNGSVTIPITDETLFVLTATNDVGVRDTAAAVVGVESAEGKVIFVAAPTLISAGQAATLAWSAAGAKAVTLKDGTGASIDLQGQLTSGAVAVFPPSTTTYTLNVDGRSYEALVEVRPTIGAFTANAMGVKPGETVTLQWQTLGATKVTVVRAGYGPVHEETDPSKVADGTFEETVPENIAAGSVFSYELVAVGATEAAQSRAQRIVYVAGEPVIVNEKFPEYARENGTFEVTWETLDTEQVEILQNGIVIFRTLTLEAALKGSATLHTPPDDTPYQLRALDLRGGVAVGKEWIVDPVGLPTLVTFTASPQPGVVDGSDPLTLQWEVTNARNLSIVARNQYAVVVAKGIPAETGTIDTYPNKYTEYELNADNGIGDRIQTTVVTATVDNPAHLIYSPATAPAGATVAVTGSTVKNGGDVAGLPVVEKNKPGEAFVDITKNGTVATNMYDYYAYVFALPELFTTRLFGQKVSSSSIIISSNGWFKLSGTANYTLDQPPYGPPGGYKLPSTYLEPFVIMPYWQDLYHTSGNVYYRIDGVGEDRRLIVQWDKRRVKPTSSNVDVTFQAQVYQNGKVVFAYKTISNSTVIPAIGIVNANESGALQAPGIPADGDTFTFFHAVPLPVNITVDSQPFSVRQLIGTNGGFIELDEQYPVLPPGQFSIVEANLNPTVADGQWIEVQNHTANTFDLGGWDIDFGGGNKHTIQGSLPLGPNGQLVLAQAAGGNDGLTVDYVWGNTVGVGTAGVSLSISGGVYTSLGPPSGATMVPGYSWQRAPLSTTGLLYISGTTQLDCASHTTSTYGSNGQHGTPGAANTTCPSFNAHVSIPANFESIKATGTLIGFTNSDGDSEAVTPPDPFVLGRVRYPTLWAGVNGWVSQNEQTCSSYPCGDSNLSSPTTSLPSGLINKGIIGIYWDDLDLYTGDVYWQRMDPDAAPGTGDEYTIVSWEGLIEYYTTSDNLNFQVKFFDNGNLEFHYGTMTGGSGSSASGWFEDPTGRTAFRIWANSSFITNNVAWRFTPK